MPKPSSTSRISTRMSHQWNNRPIAIQQLTAFADALRVLSGGQVTSANEPSVTQWTSASAGPLVVPTAAPSPVLIQSGAAPHHRNSTAATAEELLFAASSPLSSASASLSSASLVQQYAALVLYVQLCAASSSRAHFAELSPPPPPPSLEEPRLLFGAGDISSVNEAFSVAAANISAPNKTLQETSLEKLLAGGPQKHRLSQFLSTASASTHSERTQVAIRDTNFYNALEASAPKTEQQNPIRVELVDRDVWRRFHELGCEMVVTRSGRRLFPQFRVRLSGLEASRRYVILVDVVLSDARRFKYVGGGRRWMPASRALDAALPPGGGVTRRVFVHPEGAATGDCWMRKQFLSFHKLKLTNNVADQNGYMVLASMHKYVLRVHVCELSRASSATGWSAGDGGGLEGLWPQFGAIDLGGSTLAHFGAGVGASAGAEDLLREAARRGAFERVHTVAFAETEFVAVTAYQNRQITELKINLNPFAKGFRDGGNARLRKVRKLARIGLCDARESVFEHKSISVLEAEAELLPRDPSGF